MHDILTKPALWGLDPLFHSHVKIYMRVLADMIPGQWGDGDSLYFHRFPGTNQPRPIRLVNLAGVVIFVSSYTKFTRFLLDDGTGTARCMIWFGKGAPSTDFGLGDFLEVKGRLEWRQRVPVVVVTCTRRHLDPHAELLWWSDVQFAHDKAYSHEFSINISPAAEASATQQVRDK